MVFRELSWVTLCHFQVLTPYIFFLFLGKDIFYCACIVRYLKFDTNGKTAGRGYYGFAQERMSQERALSWFAKVALSALADGKATD